MAAAQTRCDPKPVDLMIRNGKIRVNCAEMPGQNGPGFECGSEEAVRGRTVKSRERGRSGARGSRGCTCPEVYIGTSMVGRGSAHTGALWPGAKVQSTLRCWEHR